MSDIKTEMDETTTDTSFNESELQDIMAEIEDLEKQFEPMIDEIDAELKTETEPTTLQETVDQEIESLISQVEAEPEITEEEPTSFFDMSDTSEETEEATATLEEETPMLEAEVETEADIIAFEPTTTETVAVEPEVTATRPSFANELNLSGFSALKLKLPIGENEVELELKDGRLSLLGSTFSIEINEDNQCVMKLDNGATFVLPLTDVSTPAKKKVA